MEPTEEECSVLESQLFDSALNRLWRTGAMMKQHISDEDSVNDFEVPYIICHSCTCTSHIPIPFQTANFLTLSYLAIIWRQVNTA